MSKIKREPEDSSSVEFLARQARDAAFAAEAKAGARDDQNSIAWAQVSQAFSAAAQATVLTPITVDAHEAAIVDEGWESEVIGAPTLDSAIVSVITGAREGADPQVLLNSLKMFMRENPTLIINTVSDGYVVQTAETWEQHVQVLSALVRAASNTAPHVVVIPREELEDAGRFTVDIRTMGSGAVKVTRTRLT